MIKDRSTVEYIREKLKTSDDPIAKAFHIGDSFRVLLFGFRKGMSIKDHDHEDIHRTKLFVVSGHLIYREESGEEHSLRQYDEFEVPAERIHKIEAVEDSLMLLTQE